LRSVVDRFWLCDDALTSGDPFEVLPDGCIEVVFALGESRGQVLVVGTTTHGTSFITKPGTIYLGMRLRPARLAGLIDAKASDLTDQRAVLERLGSASADDVLAQLHAARSFETQVAMLEGEVAHVARERLHATALDRAIDLIQDSAGTARIEQVVEAVALSRRQLERQFQDAVGLTPKQFCRVVRFQHALARLQAGEGSRAALAAELGFTDQSHLRRDFIALANRAFAV
jgi:AraC-like DNA-binding protein